LVVPPEDPASLLAAISDLRSNMSLCCNMAGNARSFARQNWNREIILARMESQLCAVIMDRGAKAANRRARNVFR
jgi:hypothetical protein